MDAQKARKYFLQETPGTALAFMHIGLFGFDALHWDPKTIELEYNDALHISLAVPTLNRLLAANQIIISDEFFRDLPAFIILANTLDSGVFSPNIFNPADTEEISTAVLESILLYPDIDEAPPTFSNEIIDYIKFVFELSAIPRPPRILSFLNIDVLPWKKIETAFSDDPIMFKAIMEIAKSRVENIDNIVLNRLKQIRNCLYDVKVVDDTAIKLLDKLQLVLKAGHELQNVGL